MKVLIAEDDRELAAALSAFVEQRGYEAKTVTTGGLDVIHDYGKFNPDVVLMDVMMPRFNGITTSHAILSKNPDAKLILMSGKLNEEHPFISTSGAICFLGKPLDLAKLSSVLDDVAMKLRPAA